MIDLWDSLRDDDGAFYPADGTGFDVPLLWAGLQTVNCHFVNDWVEIDDPNAPVSSRAPQALIRTGVLPSLAIGDQVRILGEDFTVRDLRKEELDTLLILSVN